MILNFDNWQEEVIQSLEKHKFKVEPSSNFFKDSELENECVFKVYFKGSHIGISFTKRSGVALLLIDDNSFIYLYEKMRFFKEKRLSGFAQTLIKLLEYYAKIVSAGSMLIYFKEGKYLYDRFNQSGFEKINTLENSDTLSCNIHFPNKSWYRDILPNFMKTFIKTYDSFLDFAKKYEDKTLDVQRSTMNEYTKRPGYDINYCGASIFLELSYKGAYNWKYIAHKEKSQTELTFEDKENYLQKLKNSQRLETIFEPSTFHFERFMESAQIYSIHYNTIYKAFKQNYKVEEIEVLFATKKDELRNSIKVLSEEGDYRFYRFWDYYFAGRRHTNQKSFFANSIDELKEIVITNEKDFLKRDYLKKSYEFENWLKQENLE